MTEPHCSAAPFSVEVRRVYVFRSVVPAAALGALLGAALMVPPHPPPSFGSDVDTGLARQAYTRVVDHGWPIATIRPDGFVALEAGVSCEDALRVCVDTCAGAR